MTKNITYILGAGASANALPVINEIDSRLETYKGLLYSFIQQKQRNPVTNDLNPASHQLLERLNWLIDNTKNHLTVDTFARKLFAKNSTHNDLRSLKRVLSTFFLYEQIKIEQNAHIRTDEFGVIQFKQTPDKRYDGLISSIISDTINDNALLGNIKILSWNYDSQFEQSYKEFWDFSSIHETHSALQVVPGKWIVEKGDNQEIDFTKFSLIHLNGIAGFKSIVEKPSKTLIDKYQNKIPTTDELLTDLILFFDEISNIENHTPSNEEATLFFNYAWESKVTNHEFLSPLANTAVYNAEKIAELTEILVVIGYTFPLFNRTIDKALISKMNRLTKVYIQDKYPASIQNTMQNAFERLQEPFHKDKFRVDFSLSDSLNQFILPFET